MDATTKKQTIAPQVPSNPGAPFVVRAWQQHSLFEYSITQQLALLAQSRCNPEVPGLVEFQ
jgi:hypothetical protein